MDLKIGEVIQATTMDFMAQCLKQNLDQLTLPKPPPFGSFVKVDCQESEINIIGVIYRVETGSIDNVHRPIAMNLTRQELREQQPQIFDLLKTDFYALIIGYQENNKIYQYLPPHPPQIHDFVYTCNEKEVRKITQNLDFLRTILESTCNPTDELIAATLRIYYQINGQNKEFLIKAGKELSSLLKDDYDRLKGILKRIYY